MEFSDVLAILGLLLAIYGLANDLTKAKLKLIPNFLWIVFWVTIVILFMTSFQEIKDIITTDYKFILNFFKYECSIFWKFKYFILISLNILSIVVATMFFTKLSKCNEKKFLSIIHNLAKEEEYELLNRLANNNIVKILRLKNIETFKDKYEKIKKELVLLKISKESKWYKKFWLECKKIFLKILTSFSYNKNTINDIYDFIEFEPNIKNNELIGFEKLKTLIKEKASDIEEYSQEYLTKVFKNHNSYITRQLLQDNRSNEIKKFLLNESHTISLNYIIGLTIIEILKDDKFIVELEKEYDGKSIEVRHIEKLLYLWLNNSSSLSNTVNLIEKELLKYSKLEEDIETNAFYLLKKLFDVVSQYIEQNINDSQMEITYLHDLYSGIDIENISERKKIQLACFYIDFLMANNQYFYVKLEEFKNYVENDYKLFFMTVINNTDRELCEDNIGFAVNDEKHARSKWDEIIGVLE